MDHDTMDSDDLIAVSKISLKEIKEKIYSKPFWINFYGCLPGCE
jgi:hypothetical protein